MLGAVKRLLRQESNAAKKLRCRRGCENRGELRLYLRLKLQPRGRIYVENLRSEYVPAS